MSLCRNLRSSLCRLISLRVYAVSSDSPPVVTKAPPSKTKTASGQSIKNFYGSSSDSKATARGTRVSARNANKAGIWNRKDLKSIQMDKSDKVKDLKPKVRYLV